MKLWAKILMVLAVAIGALLAYFWLRPDTDAKNNESVASISLSDDTQANAEVDPSLIKENTPIEPKMDGFSGIETEIDALSESL